MNELIQKYEAAKLKAKKYMSNGQITAYFQALLEVNRYENLLITIVAN